MLFNSVGWLFGLTVLLSMTRVFGSSKPVATRWGLQDAGAIVGKVFLYTIPDDAFTGDIDSYEISEAGSDNIPRWLNWKKEKHQLLGVPSYFDLGPHYISVTAVGTPLNNTHISVSKDIFTIHVQEESPKNPKKNLPTSEEKNQKQAVNCGHEEPIVTVALLLDVDFDILTPLQRVEILENVAKSLVITVDRLRLHPLVYEHSLKRDLLMAGPGESPSQAQKGTYVVWKIGCGYSLHQSLTSYVATVETQAGSGTLAAHIGYPIVSWQVTTGKIEPRKRRRLQGYVTATPTFEPTPLTSPEIDARPTTTSAPEVQPTRTWGPIVPTVTLEESPSPPARTTPKRQRFSTTTTATPDLPPTRRPGDSKPSVSQTLSSFTCYRGIVCRIRIPRNTFTDAEDGDTYALKLRLEPLDETKENWMFLDKRGRNVLGFIMKGGTWNYRLAASDSNGQMASTAFVVQVVEQLLQPANFSHQFTMRLKMHYKDFTSNVTYQVLFVRKLARAIGDRDASSITVTDIRAGSTVIVWSNNSLPTDVCPLSQVSRLRSKMLTQSRALRTDFINSMGKEFAVSKISLDYTGVCLETKSTTKVISMTPSPETTDPKSKTSAPIMSDDFLISTVVPIIIIFLLLIVAIIIACILYRRNRKNKKAATKEAKSEYVSKGLPVVFPEEVEQEKEALNATTPLLIKEERPPLEPPSDDFGRQNGQNGTPFRGEELNGQGPRSTSTPNYTQHENPLYKPPPPIEMTSTKSPRPKHTLPHQREPPPYMPP